MLFIQFVSKVSDKKTAATYGNAYVSYPIQLHKYLNIYRYCVLFKFVLFYYFLHFSGLNSN